MLKALKRLNSSKFKCKLSNKSFLLYPMSSVRPQIVVRRDLRNKGHRRKKSVFQA
jgi:hypothetical protein